VKSRTVLTFTISDEELPHNDFCSGRGAQHNVPALSCGGEWLLFGECYRDLPSIALQEVLDQRVPVNLNAMLGGPTGCAGFLFRSNSSVSFTQSTNRKHGARRTKTDAALVLFAEPAC